MVVASIAYDVGSREETLDRREQELALVERALDARWTVHEQRLRVLRELRDFAVEHEATLRQRALRLGLDNVTVDRLLSLGDDADWEVEVDGGTDGISTERAGLGSERGRVPSPRKAPGDRRPWRLQQANRA